MTGFEHLPGHLLLGLETGSHMGGFDNLKELLDLFDVDLGIWMTSLGSGVKFQLAQSSDVFASRNGFWYLPAQDYTSVLRLCGALYLDSEGSLGSLGEMIAQCLPGLTSQLSFPDLKVVFKRTAAPVIEGGNTYIDGASEVTLWTELDIGSPKSLGLYFSLLSDRMVITVLSNAVTWSSLKEWMAKQFEDLGDALLSLEEDLAVLISSRGTKKDDKSPAVATATEAAGDLDGISFHKLALTVSKDRDLLGGSVNFKASMPYLVQQGKHAIFELGLSWNPGLYEFKGTFIPAVMDLDDPILDGYMIDHEIWNSPIPLSPNPAPGLSVQRPQMFRCQIHLDEIFIDYTYAGASVSKLKLGGSMTIAGVTTSVEYNRSEHSDWKLQATVEKSIVVDILDKKPETLGDTLQGLLGGDVAAILPDFVRNITFPDFEPDHDHVQLTCTSRAFGVFLSIGKLHVQLDSLGRTRKTRTKKSYSLRG
ncbi:hypothetical protein BFJ69_g14339 [Fusarium oxysporum]|uniref:Uncharacterized protein n=1 Tax=Fusarium oxysporum TaxID=5507 RepID=A0A420MHX5_FUSOX|nr:hypothetical protein BFJ69_g14339 [Fusarium oxysporum]